LQLKPIPFLNYKIEFAGLIFAHPD